MIELTNKTIDKAIVNKAYNMVSLANSGFIMTNETICTFNSLIIFKSLFVNKCKMLDNALEKLYYIVSKLFNCKDVEPEDEDEKVYYNVTVNTSPSEATVTMNGTLSKSINFEKGTNVSIVAHLDGYRDKTISIVNLSKDEYVDIVFTDDDKISSTYSVIVGTPNPSNAVIKINGIERPVGYQVLVAGGTVLTVLATADGYYDYVDSIVVNSDITIEPILQRIPPTPPEPEDEFTVIVNSVSPSDASITFNDVVTQVRQPRIYSVGETVVVVVNASGYQPFRGEYTEDAILDIVLTPVTPDPEPEPEPGDEDFNVVITLKKDNDNGPVITNATVKAIDSNDNEYNLTNNNDGTYSGTLNNGTYKFKVNAPGYMQIITPTNNYTEDYSITFYLTEIKFILSVNILDSSDDSVITGANLKAINVSTQEEFTGSYDSTNHIYKISLSSGTYNIIASKTGYSSNSVQNLNVNSDEEITIKLTADVTPPEPEPDKYTLTINTIPSDADCTIDGVSTKTKTVTAGTTCTVVVSKTGYITETRTYTVNSDMTETIELTQDTSNMVHIQVDTQNHPGASVTMNGVSQTDGYYNAGDNVLIVITAQGYNKEIWYVRAQDDITITPQMSQASENPDPSNINLRMQAIQQPQILPFLSAEFLVDNNDTVSMGQNYQTTSTSHIISISKTGYQEESFEYGYTGDTDIYFVLADES